MSAPHPLWTGTFRPFFLLASAFAATAMAAWTVVVSGLWALPLDVRWHAHELLYGFFSAILCGFLLTAAKNWSNQPPVTGGRLVALVAAWVLGRAAMLVPAQSAIAAVRFASVLAPALLFVFLFGYLKHPGQEKNRSFLAAVALFALGDGLSLLSGPVAAAPFLHAGNGLWLGVHLSQWLMVLMSGKTMPLFIERAVGVPIRSWPWVERASSWTVVAALAADLFDAPAPVLAVACGLAAAANAVRLYGFHPLKALRSRLLFLVAIGYGFLVVGYAALCATTLLALPPVMVVHLFTAGAMSAMIFSITSRIALGHTGRPIAVPALALAGSVLAVVAGVLRGAVGLWPSLGRWHLVPTAGLAFAAAWALYFLWSAPFLLKARADGKPG